METMSIEEKEKKKVDSIIQNLIDNEVELIKDSKYLLTGVIPDQDWYYQRNGMEMVLRHIHNFLVMGGSKMIYLHGGNGVGKTATVNMLIKSFQEKLSLNKQYPDEIDVIRVDCKARNTSHAIIKGIVDIDKKISKSDASKMFQDFLHTISKPTIIFLDDLQELADDNVFYKLSRPADIVGEVRNILVIVTSKYDIQNISRKFTEHTESSLNAKKEYFSNYDENALYEILVARAKKALFKYDKYMIRHIAKPCAKRAKGDARIAIKVLEHVVSDDKYSSWVDEFMAERTSLEARETTAIPDEDAVRITKLVAGFDSYIKDILDRVLSNSQIQFMSVLESTEIVTLYQVVYYEKKYGNAYMSQLYGNQHSKNIGFLMTNYAIDKFIERMERIDLVSLVKVHVKKSYQNRIEHKLTPQAIAYLENKYEELVQPIFNKERSIEEVSAE